MCKTKPARSSTEKALRHSCVPLLLGNRKAILKTARLLYRDHRLYSYALLSEAQKGIPLSPFYLTYIPASFSSRALLSHLAIHFFKLLDASQVPVLIDCTEEGSFISDPTLSALLEKHAFLTDHTHYKACPPFCYLTEEKKTEEGSDRHAEEQTDRS